MDSIESNDPWGGNLSFTQLLANVDASSSQQISRFCNTISESLCPDEEIQPEIPAEEARRGVVFDMYVEETNSESSEDDKFCFLSDDESVAECDLSQLLPGDDSELYDYDYVPPESPLDETENTEDVPSLDEEDVQTHTWKKRKRQPSGVALPNCRKSIGLGAVEIALRKSAKRDGQHIFKPALGMTFDSVAEAYNFYNMYSWEVGFGIRNGNSHKNSGGEYKSMHMLECTNAGSDNRVKHRSTRCKCKAMVRLLRTEDHAWYISTFKEEHNHGLAVGCAEKMQWRSHRLIDQLTRDMIQHLRDNNVPISQVHGVLGSYYGSVKDSRIV